MEKYVRFFEELGIGDVPLVGGKNASLGEMYRKLAPTGVRVPNGFAITAEPARSKVSAGSPHAIMVETNPLAAIVSLATA